MEEYDPMENTEDLGMPNPTPKEIRQRCEEIQRQWSNKEERQRRSSGGQPQKRWFPPQIECMKDIRDLLR